jgi:hypothetical protein
MHVRATSLERVCRVTGGRYVLMQKYPLSFMLKKKGISQEEIPAGG